MVSSGPVQPASRVNRTPRLPVHLLVVGGLLLVVHLAVRNHSLGSLNEEITALDTSYLMDALARVTGGERAYTPVVSHYGPYWMAYFVGMMKLFGVSLGGVQWGVALLGWLRSVVTYALTSRLAGRGWGLAAVAITLVSPPVRAGTPYGAYMSSVFLLLFAGAVLWALAAGASGRRWFMAGVLIGLMVGTRWSSACIALAAIGIVGGATALLHPPLRHGHLVGTVGIPGLLLASAGLLLWQNTAISWIAFAPPALGAAVLAGTESWRRRGTGPASWRAWLAAPGWCVAGIVAATLVWLVPFALSGDVATRVHDMFFRYAASVQVGRWFTALRPPLWEYMELFAPARPRPGIIACWLLLFGGWVVHARADPRTRWRLTSAALVVGAVILGVGMVHAGAFGASKLADHFWLRLSGPAYLLWCVHHARRPDTADASPPWLVPLACLAGVTFLDGAPVPDWVHVNCATAVLIVFGVVAAHQAWRTGKAYSPLLGPALAAAAVPLVAAHLLVAANLWWTLPLGSWDLARRDLAWLDVPRGQVWEEAAAVRELTANVQFLQTALPPTEPCFAFPDALYLYLADRRSIADVTYFQPGYSAPHVDGTYASHLHESPPALVLARFNPQGILDHPSYLAEGFPRIIDTLEAEYRLIHQIGMTRYYVPRRGIGR